MSDLIVPLVCLLAIVVVIGAVIAVVLRRDRARKAGSGPVAEDTTASTASTASTVTPAGTAAPSSPTPTAPAERPTGERRTRTTTVRLQPLTDDVRRRYAAAWDGVRTRFREQPVLALSEADTVLEQLLADRGLPSDGAHSASLTPEHARVLLAYRAGQALEQANTSLRSDQEQVRQGMAHFEEVFAVLLADDPAGARSG